jgi:hypothetical protein
MQRAPRQAGNIVAMTALTIVRATMILATVAWALGEIFMRRSIAFDRIGRRAWTIGVTLAAVHVTLAFEFVYAWDHAAAVSATARQAAEHSGWEWRGALYVNYLFLALWFADVLWWWAAPASHASRSPRFEAARLAVFAFMFFNGAVLFASAAGRIVGIPAVAAALIGSPVFRRVAVTA